MKLIELCRYTLRQSLSDTGNTYAEPFVTAQDILNNLNNEGGK